MAEVAEERKVGYVRMDEGTVWTTRSRWPSRSRSWRRRRSGSSPSWESLHHSFPGGQIDRYAHSLQTATRAEDAGRVRGDRRRGPAARHRRFGSRRTTTRILGAEVLRPFVSRHTYWMLRHHDVSSRGTISSTRSGWTRNARERHRGHPAWEMTVRFTGDYDQMAFDPAYETRPIEHFEPMVRRIFARQPWGAQTQEDWPVED